MNKFDIKKAWPVAIAAAAMAAGAQAGVKTGTPMVGVYTSGLIGGSYYLQISPGYTYTPLASGASSLPAVSTTVGLIIVDLKGTGTTPTWGFALNSGAVGQSQTTMVSTFTTTSATCNVTYFIQQDVDSYALSLFSGAVSNVVLNSGKSATSTDSTACGSSFAGRTGLSFTNGVQNTAATYTHIF